MTSPSDVLLQLEESFQASKANYEFARRMYFSTGGLALQMPVEVLQRREVWLDAMKTMERCSAEVEEALTAQLQTESNKNPRKRNGKRAEEIGFMKQRDHEKRSRFYHHL